VLFTYSSNSLDLSGII